VRSRALWAAGLAALALIVYAPLRHHAFLDYDDDRYITENPNLRLPLDAAALRRAFEPHETNWIPLTWLSLHVDYRLHGLRPAPYLLENAGLHAASSALLFLALVALTGAAGRSAFVAAVFAAHPLHVESVAWASERKDALSGLFWMLGLLAYAGYAARPALWRYALVLASLALGLLAKPSLVTFPFVLWLLDVWPLGRLRWRALPGVGSPGADARARAESRRAIVEKVPMLLLVAADAVATFLVQRTRGAMTELHEYPLGGRIANAAESIVAYVADAFWPSGLAVFYPHPGLAISPWRAGLCALALAAVTAAALRLRRTRPYLAVGWLWFVGTLVPVLGIVQVGLQARADRYTYLPLVGLSLALAWGGFDLARARGVPRRALAAGAVVAVAALCAATRVQLRHWRDTIALFERAVAVSPDGALPQHHLGLALVNADRALEARPHLERAIALGADSAEAHVGLAVAYEQLGHYPESIEHARAALRIAPGHPQATLHLVRVLATCPDPELRDPAEAVRLAEAARAPDADLLEALAMAYASAGRSAEALRALEQAATLAELAGDAERARVLRARLVAERASARESRPEAPRGR
jgi:tetratricopeptide (TPR) repeat protein